MAADCRVLLVTPDFPPGKGGVQVLLERLSRNAGGLEFRVLTLGQEGDAEFDRDAPVDVHRVAGASIDRRLAGLVLNAASLREAARFRPDVILSGHLVASLGAIAMKRLFKVPLVQYFHAEEIRSRPRLAGAAARAADVAIAVSSYSKELAVAAGAPPDRIEVIHPGVDLPQGFRAERSGPPTLLTVATMLFRYKGHDVIVRALPLIRAQVPDARWVAIGDGPFRPAVESLLASYGVDDAASLLGRVEDDERDAWLDRASLFCMPSRQPADGIGGEGFGIVYMEAAAHGLPSIGGAVAGARDAIRSGVTGVLVDPTDHIALATAATELLADPARAAAMGEAARGWAEEHAWPKIAAKVEAVIRRAAGR